MTATDAQSDKYHGVWIIFLILGLGTLLAWNFIVTATMYFTSRLKYSAVAGIDAVNGTGARGNTTQNALQSIFSNALTLTTMVPQLIFTCLNSFIHQRIPQTLRISGSLTVILVVLLLTAVLVKVEVAPVPFFCLTLVKIFCLETAVSISQGSLFGLAGLFPVSYTTPMVSGQGLAGVVAAVSLICSLATASSQRDSAFGYFVTGCVVTLLANLSYLALPSMEFFQFYTESNRTRTMSQKNRSVAFSLTEEDKPFVSVVGAKSSIAEEGGAWDTYFIPVSCFLLFNVMDTAGKSLTGLYIWPGADSIWLPFLVGVRVIFVPLFMLCNVQPRHHLPVWFGHDSWYILFMMVFSLSGGYVESLCLCVGPRKVARHEAETAGIILVFFLALGLVLGAVISFGFRAMI